MNANIKQFKLIDINILTFIKGIANGFKIPPPLYITINKYPRRLLVNYKFLCLFLNTYMTVYMI